MDYQSSTGYLLSLGNEVSAMKLGLANIRRLLSELGDPQTRYLKIQVAGTNGKGSVCAFLGSICNEAGIRTGVFTSPHLISITERIKINGSKISEHRFAEIATRVKYAAEHLIETGEIEYLPTFFEQITAIALTAFAEAEVELAILETGLGGRLDATTASNAEIAVITRIDLDHQEYLGTSIEEIAAEKAAIIGPHTKAVVVGSQDDRAMNVVMDKCASLGVVPLTNCLPQVSAIDTSKRSAVVEFKTERGIYRDSSLGLAGRHQVENACVAVLAAESLALDLGLSISVEHIWSGLENARHPGRLEYIGRYLLDGAHNPGGAAALARFLGEFEAGRSITMVFGAMEGKNVQEMLRTLSSIVDSVVFTRPENSRSARPEELSGLLPTWFDRSKVCATSAVRDALRMADAISQPEDLILVTGSLYLVGEAKGHLQQKTGSEI